MKDIKERIENLTKQQEQAREVFLKCLGAIEVLTEMLNEKKK
tara:strand:+ start:473 stop:598 length:126 start_codon:yes stop_codon:yes gene_type:complete